jgi:hypothetical protein
MEASGLDAREHAAAAAAERGHAVERAVEEGAVAQAQKTRSEIQTSGLPIRRS